MQMYPGANWEAHKVDARMNPFEKTATNTPGFGMKERNLGVGPLYKSRNEQALLTDKMVAPFFGELPTGLVMGIIASGSFKSQVFPADFVVKASSASGTSIVVTDEEAQFFPVGCTVALGGKEVGTVTEVSSDGTNTTLTVDKSISESSTDLSYPADVYCVIDQPVVSTEQGAYTSAIYSNAVLYKCKMQNLVETMLEKLHAFIDGPYVVIR